MGRIALLVLVFVSLNVYAQKSNKRDPLYQTRVEAFLIKPGHSIVISTYDDTKEFQKTLYLKAILETCKPQSGVSLILKNGEVINLPAAIVTCEEKDGVVYTVTEIDLTDNLELYNKLKTNDIVKYQIGKNQIPVVFKEKGEDLKLIIKFSEEKN